MTTHCPPDFTGITLHILDYLHGVGVVRDPAGDQVTPVRGEEDRPACYVGGWDDEPDHAITIVGPYNVGTDSDKSPIVEFTVAIRSAPWDLDQLTTTSQAVLTALTIHHTTPLTAPHAVMYCRRVRTDTPTRDANHRWRVAHTYQARPTYTT